MNYGKTSQRTGIWHKIRPYDDDDEPSYCGLGMLSPQRWYAKTDTIPAGELICLRCETVVLDR